MFASAAAGSGRRSITVILALWAWLPIAQAADVLVLPEAEGLALARDAGLEDLQARQEALLQASVAESRLPDPEFLVGANNVPVDSFDLDREAMTQLVVGLRQRFPAGDTLDLSRDRLEAMAGANTAVQAERRRQVVRALRQAWIEAAWHARAIDLVAAEQQWYEELEEAVAAAYASGRRRQDELIRIGLERDALVEEQVRFRESRAPWEAELGRLLGEDARRARVDDLPKLPALPPRERAADLIEAHPVLAAHAGEAQAEAVAVDIARQRYKPSWMLDVRYGFRDGEDPAGRDRSDMLTAMVSFDLPIFTGERQDRRVSSARASERAVRRRLENERRSLVAATEAAWDRHARLGERIELYDVQILPAAGDYVEATVLAYQNGLAPFDELVRAEKMLLEARLKKLRLVADRLVAEAELAYLIGATP